MKQSKIQPWLKTAVIAAVMTGAGQTSLAWSPEPWRSGYDQEEDPIVSAILQEAKKAHRDNNDPEEAYRILSRRDNPADSEEIMFWRAWYANELGRVDEAERLYWNLIGEKSQDGLSELKGALERAFNWETKYGRYHNALGHLLATAGYAELEKATAQMLKAFETSPNDPAFIHSFGYVMQKYGDLEEAEKLYQRALDQLESRFDEDKLFFDYGTVLLISRPGNPCPFAKFVDGMLAAQSEDPEFSLRLFGFCSESFYEEMAGLLDEYVRKHPDRAKARIFHAVLLHQLENEAGAKQRMNEAHEIIDRREFQDFRASAGSLADDMEMYGFAAQEMGLAREAEKVYEGLIIKDISNPWHHIRLGCLLAEEGRSAQEVTRVVGQALDLASDRQDVISAHENALSVRLARAQGEEARCGQ